MARSNSFREANLPYDKLALVGITKDGINSMPETLRSALLSGIKTPLIEARMKSDNGWEFLVPLRIQLTRDQDGQPLMLVFPIHKELNVIPGLSRDDNALLMNGEVILRNIGRASSPEMCYLQFDPESNYILHKAAKDVAVADKLNDVEKINDITLGAEQKKRAREGKPVELNVGGEKVTVGVDLRHPNHFKTLKGDMNEWERQQAINYDIEHPEFMGFVQTDQNRWEYRMVVDELSGKKSMNLKNSPKQTKSSGMKI